MNIWLNCKTKQKWSKCNLQLNNSETLYILNLKGNNIWLKYARTGTWKRSESKLTYHGLCFPPVQQSWGWESSSSPEVWSPQSDLIRTEWYPGGVVENWHRTTLLIPKSLGAEPLTALNDWPKTTLETPLHQSQWLAKENNGIISTNHNLTK